MSKAVKKTQQLASQQAKDNVRKQIIKLYERKQYKKALKLADSILKVQPDHGEARSLKGLVLSATGQKDQALECAKLGLRNDLQSHVCWHVLGLVHRSVQEYTQSIKCYRGALRYDPENQQILRDLALLQIHVRDLDGYWETRRRLLQAKPTQKANWMALAIAEQLRGNLDTTLSILDGYGSLHVEEQDSRTPEGDYEFSEFTMFKASVLCEANKYQEAWNLISANESRITDFDALNTMKVDILLKLNKVAEAQAVAQRMVTINPDNLQSHATLQRTMSLLPDAAGNYTADQVAQLEQLYEHLAQELPRWCKAVRSVPLSFLPDGDKFLVKLEQYIKPALIKGVPALHSTLRPLYKDSAKIARIESLLRTYITSLRETGKFPGDEKPAPPSAIMWTMLVLAHHLNAVKRFEEALAIVNQGIEHTPTALELYMCKAKIYKSAGDIKRAAYEMNQVRLLDLADRFLNTKATKYFLRADQIKEAEEVVMLFTKQEDGLSNLFDMQCMWYELEYGASAIRRGELGIAIKKLLDVYKHFNTIVEDQLDYHTYCLRKMALRSYVAMLRLEDNIYSHPKILKALTSAVQSLFDLHDNPRHQAIPQPDTQDKKELAKWTREEKRRQTQEAAAAAAMTAEQREALAYEKLAAPLQEATKYVKVLLKFHPNELGAQVAAFELYLRKGKLLLALRAVNKLLALAPNSPEAHVSRIKLVAAFTKIAEPNATVAAVVQAEAKRILGADSGDLAKDMQTCADAYLAQAQSLAQRTAALHVLQLIGAGAPALQAAAAHVVAYTPSSTDTIYADYRAAHKAVAQVAPDEAARYLEQLKQTFPLHEFFSGVSSVPTQEEQTATATEAAATSSETNE